MMMKEASIKFSTNNGIRDGVVLGQLTVSSISVVGDTAVAPSAEVTKRRLRRVLNVTAGKEPI